MRRIVLDTNFVIAAVENRIDVATQLTELLEEKALLVVPEPCLNELKSIVEPKFFNFVQKFLLASNAEIIPSVERKADEAILEYAVKSDALAVCTLDAGLRKRLKNKGIQVISLRDKTRLVFA